MFSSSLSFFSYFSIAFLTSGKRGVKIKERDQPSRTTFLVVGSSVVVAVVVVVVDVVVVVESFVVRGVVFFSLVVFGKVVNLTVGWVVPVCRMTLVVPVCFTVGELLKNTSRGVVGLAVVVLTVVLVGIDLVDGRMGYPSSERQIKWNSTPLPSV